MRSRPGIGALRKRLELESFIDTPDASGGFSRDWQSVASVWGDIETVKSTGDFIAQQGVMELTHRIRIRWRPDIAASMRLRAGANIFEIVAAQDADANRRFLICQCREVRP